MIGYMNKCPLCGAESSFVPEEMECDQSLVLWCKHCGDYINQTITLESLRRWWARYDAGEDAYKPPVSKNTLLKFEKLEQTLANEPDCNLNRVEIHLKDFTNYHYTDVEETQ
ncbi:hypothetical protein B4V02_18260 [Paenibacillus kribbensis]|uniref:Uncharacterized protein n=1 Tax=Paenibacillus kribbensis TaxID=172713 RepID=A0A222WS42_9BACL|nr:hypothetical protein [Paenibacillus kribbensis]ASR48503.1 hypothetical protein B4V02_18260 [Paenibacillus kribbensis]